MPLGTEVGLDPTVAHLSYCLTLVMFYQRKLEHVTSRPSVMASVMVILQQYLVLFH